MIRLSDAFIIASTKLHTHRIRTLITIVLSSLLFSALILAIIITQGATNSIAKFNNEGLNNRYIVWAQSDSPFNGEVLSSKEIISLVNQKEASLITAKKAEAKKLGIDYNAENEPAATITQTTSGQSNSVHINMQSYAVTEALWEYVNKNPGPGISELEQVAKPYHSIGIYSSVTPNINGGNIAIMQDGKENFEPTDSQRVDINFLHNAPIAIDDSELARPYLFKNVKVSDGNIPLIVSYSTAESMLGLSQLSSNASTKEQYDRIQQLYRQTSDGSLTVSTCYRNSVSQSQIDLAISQATEISKNINNKDYQKPKLIYGLPTADSCDKATIVSDTRTDTEKKLQAAQDQFDTDFGQIITPIQQKITFQVIGLSPSEANSDNTTFGNLLSGIVGSSLTNGASVIPSDLLNQVPNVSTIKSILLSDTGTPLGVSRPSYYVEFSNADDARAFISEKSCTTRADGTCASPGRLFQLITSGNNSIALQDLQTKLTNIISITTLAIVIFAIIIMATMVGRTITDSRHETAVFRALGAKRSDIASIYALYALSITFFIAVLSTIIGVGLAYYINIFYNQNATLQAKILFDAVNTNLTFNLFDINISLIGIAIATIFITGLISMTIPILRNIRRSPIQDMREE